MIKRSIHAVFVCLATACLAPLGCSSSTSTSDAATTAKGGAGSVGTAATGGIGGTGTGGSHETGGTGGSGGAGGSSTGAGSGGRPSDASSDQSGPGAGQDSSQTDAIPIDGATVEVAVDVANTETGRDLLVADIAGDASPDSPILVLTDGGIDLTTSLLDGGIDAVSCGTCPSGLTCGGGGDPLRCGITVTTQAGKVCSPDGWCWMTPKPQGNDLGAAYATSANDIWAVGQAGTVLHYDGNDWSGTSGLLTQFATDPNESTNQILNQKTFNAVWASGPGDAWIATGSGVLALQGDGTHWNQVVVPSATESSTIVDVWGTGPNDVWLLDSGTHNIFRGSGSSWTKLTPPKGAGLLASIWGMSANEVYVAGNLGLYRFDGTSWYQESSKEITGLWGSAAAGMWAYCSNSVYHRVGTTWVQLTAPSTCGSGLWGTSESSMWLGSCYFDGSSWHTLVDTWFSAVTGTADGGAVAVGVSGRISTMTASAATPYPSLALGKYFDVAVGSATNVWFVGLDASAILDSQAIHWDGTSLTLQEQTSPYELLAVTASPGGAVWASGASSSSSGSSLYSPWQLSTGKFVADTTGPTVAFWRMWAAADDAIWAVTANDAAIYAYDGSSWKAASHLLSSSSTVTLSALRGSASNDVWVGGSAGVTEHWNGSQWTAYSTPVSDKIVGLWSLDASHAWAATSVGNILTWDGSQWSNLTNLALNLSDIHGCSASDIWVANDYLSAPILHHYDGTTWKDSNLGVYTVNGPRVGCAASGDVWMINGIYGILRRQGS